MASVHVRYSPWILQGAEFSEEQSHDSGPCEAKLGFPQSKLLQRGSNTPPEQSSPNSELRSSFTLNLRKWRSGEELLRIDRTTINWINLLCGKSFSWENSRAKVTKNFKLKINVIQKTLNFRHIQQSHQCASPISWDYPFKAWSVTEFLKQKNLLCKFIDIKESTC
jgi:hypothetical protein